MTRLFLLVATLSALAQALSSSSCPNVPTSTWTSVIYSTSFVYTKTTTTTTTITPSVVITSPTKSMSTTYTGGATITASTTVTETYVTIAPASKTVTVPIPQNFTPVLCEPSYINPTVTSTFTGTYTTISTKTKTNTPKTTTTLTYFSFTGTSVITTQACPQCTQYEYPTFSSTITRSDPTRTVYAACLNTNNVWPLFPGGTPLDHANPIDPQARYEGVPAADAQDCCNQCQAAPGCAGSSWQVYSYPHCYHFFNNDGSCNASVPAALAYERSPGLMPVYISNSGCGQVGICHRNLYNPSVCV